MTDQRLALDFAASSDRGLVRTNNEDSAYAGPRLLTLAGRVATHAIGEGQQAWARVGGAPIIRAHQTAVGGRGEI